jgi:hypothetical protein
MNKNNREDVELQEVKNKIFADICNFKEDINL